MKAALKDLINNKAITTQKGLCNALEQQGYNINQSTISRVLRQIGAVKTRNLQNQISYCLPKETNPPPTQTQLSNLIIKIQKNEAMVVVHTSPGAASLIARILDYHINHLRAIGIISGDDTIFITPDSVNNTNTTYCETYALLSSLPH